MSSVSADAPESAADLTARANGSRGAPAGAASGANSASTDFGPNEWLVDELYQRYQADPGSVDRAWWNFFADYHPKPPEQPRPAGAARTASAGQAPTAPAVPAAGGAAGGQSAAGPANGPAAGGPATAAPAPGAPAAPARGTPAPVSSTLPAPARPAPPPPDAQHAIEVRLRGAAARTAANMTASLTVPTATSVRAIPAKLLVDNRIVINNHLGRGRGGKVSFTHLIGYAVVRALAWAPEMNYAYAEEDGKPVLVQPEHVNLGLAIDVRKRDGTRQLLVPGIKAAETMDFRHFWMAYEDIVRKARTGKLAVEDFAGTTISLTNPGTIGTEHSVPRLVTGQGCIVGVGAMEYPAAYQGASEETLVGLAISKTVTLTSTYDHRII